MRTKQQLDKEWERLDDNIENARSAALLVVFCMIVACIGLLVSSVPILTAGMVGMILFGCYCTYQAQNMKELNAESKKHSD